MSLFESSLSKLTIESYKDEKMTKAQYLGRFEAMYNPAALDLSYSVQYSETAWINDTEITSGFNRVIPGDLNLELILDATMPGNSAPIDKQLAKLRQLTTPLTLNSSVVANNAADAEGTPYLKVLWGNMQWYDDKYFAGRLASLAVSYTLFDRDGTPLRATARIALKATSNRNSTGVPTAGREIPGTTITLPSASNLALAAMLAASAVLGAAGAIDYLTLAFDNALDCLDDFEPGDVLRAVTEAPSTGGA
ncbi:CIS tube protein [Collimonas humicola]|uniref:CIS tube protein n=1 Tax=Collimonas humicola TaxID=2825886 RepID=UPI001B8D450E|nr:hypothetical protein [Collimonas humicola]